MKSIESTSLSKKELLLKFIQQNPFATVMLTGKDLLTTYTPVLNTKDDEFVLFGHISKDNPQYKYLVEGKSALIIYERKDLCISTVNNEPNEEDDFSAIHVNGHIKLQSEEELKNSLQITYEVLRKYYNYNDKEYPINNDIIEKQIDLVTGFYCKPTLINPILKLKQSH